MAIHTATFKAFEKAMKDLGPYYVEIGVISGKSKNSRKETAKMGVTNADLMFIHENGSHVNNIPKRPVLQMTIDYAKKELLPEYIYKACSNYISSGFKREAFEKPLKQMCIKMEGYARDIIYSNDGRLTPNAPSTIRKKGDNHPLFDTGQLARSITCRLVQGRNY